MIPPRGVGGCGYRQMKCQWTCCRLMSAHPAPSDSNSSMAKTRLVPGQCSGRLEPGDRDTLCTRTLHPPGRPLLRSPNAPLLLFVPRTT
jgi:hypothetical protein